MTATRSGAVVAATWLIGLGVVFLVQRAMNVGWGEAWPLFVILVGVAGFVSTAVARPLSLAGIWSFTWPVVWTVVGVILRMSTTGSLGQDPVELIVNGWPWLAVGLGVWFVIGALVPFGPGLVEQLVVPVAGATAAMVRVKFGAGQLRTRPAAPGNLIDGEFAGGVRQRIVGPGQIELSQDTDYGVPWVDRRYDWTLGLASDVPLDLRFDTGASRSVLDLRGLLVRRLELHTGASDTRLIVPEGAGATAIKAETGAASLTVEVPPGVAARIRTQMALGSSQVDESRFPRTADGYESADYATALNRVDLDLQGGVGSLRVVGIPA
jgi:hypothetical protein